MPRIDRTYTAEDILRFFANNLSPGERVLVLEGLSIEEGQNNIQEEEVDNLIRFMIQIAGLVLPTFDKVLDAGEALGDLMNQADIQEARQAAAFMTRRVGESLDLLRQIDF